MKKPFKPRQRRQYVRPPQWHDNVYIVLCPHTGAVVYVGRTGGDIQQRIAGHFSLAMLEKNMHLPFTGWKLAMLTLGIMPEFKVVATIPSVAAGRLEMELIRHYHRLSPLYNAKGVTC